jgi:hypothetical protein
MSMSAIEIRLLLARHLLRQSHWLAVAHEFAFGLGICDVFAVNRNLFTTEFEIKTRKDDLELELNSIRCFAGEVYPADEIQPCRKRLKHMYYLGRTNQHLPRPNSFYFAVPPTLTDLCLQGVANTDYGVISVGDPNFGGEPVIRKKADKIHADRFTLEQLQKLARRLSWISYGLSLRDDA